MTRSGRTSAELSVIDGVPYEPMQNEAHYICDACGEEIVIPLDLTQGRSQQYVEDCPVCCRPNIIHVDIDGEGQARAWSEPEQDYQ